MDVSFSECDHLLVDSSLLVRALGLGDEGAVDAFFKRNPESTLFLRSKVRNAGLCHDGSLDSGDYVAAMDSGIIAVAAHYPTGNIVLAAPHHLERLLQVLVDVPNRVVEGLAGPWAQVERARIYLGMADSPVQLLQREALLAVELDQLTVPSCLTEGSVCCRLPEDGELDLLTQMRTFFLMETFNTTAQIELQQACRKEVEHHVSNGTAKVLINRAGSLVACAFLGSVFPDIVEISGVYTLPELRGRGYGRAIVAGTLREACERGVQKAILTVDRWNVPARKVYRSIGFQRVGDYGLIRFAEDVHRATRPASA
tara:strand:+ start:42767 stop:43705 length:939 start_codon:yes stop_codon:yes gene_type:complete